MKKLLVLVLILFAASAFASTAYWEHDCTNTTGFRLYYDTTVMGEVLCPDRSLTMDLPDGVYTVTAYNEIESEHSEPFLLAAYYYNSIKYDYRENGMLQYKGEHTNVSALDTDTNWIISRYYYQGDILIGIKIRTTSWTNRTTGW